MLKKHGGYVDGWTAGDVIKEVLEDRKGSKGLPRWVSNRLVRFHAQKSAAVRIAHLGSKSAYIFDPAVCKEWLAMGGKKAILLFMEKRRDRERGMFKLVPTEAS